MFKMLIVLFAVVGLSSCGTVAGLGDDIKSVAKWSENKMSETNEEPKENSDFPVVNTEPVAAKEIE
mgnify:CR=1 FL=1